MVYTLDELRNVYALVESRNVYALEEFRNAFILVDSRMVFTLQESRIHSIQGLFCRVLHLIQRVSLSPLSFALFFNPNKYFEKLKVGPTPKVHPTKKLGLVDHI